MDDVCRLIDAIFSATDDDIEWAIKKDYVMVIADSAKNIGGIMERAIVFGSRKIFDYILEEHRLDPNYKGGKLLVLAIIHNRLDMAGTLIERGARVNRPDAWKGLDLAVYHQKYDMAELLIRLGADVHAFNELSLATAAKKRDSTMVRLLVRYGAQLSDQITFDNRQFVSTIMLEPRML